MTPLPVLGTNYTPTWATEERVEFFPPSSVELVKECVEAVVSRYSSPPFNLTYYEVGNEPNIGWFWRTMDPEALREQFIDRILIPAAQIIRKHGGQVVAPSITLEWPDHAWPTTDRPERKCYNAGWCLKEIQDWLLFHDAWRHIDYFSLHYSKGDTAKSMLPFADNLMPIYDYLFEAWIRPGKIKGIWNTEEGLTCTEAGSYANISLEPWEMAPYGQWVPRYTIPLLHWAIGREWRHAHQYKMFWYNIRSGGALSPTSILAGEEGTGIAAAGKAMAALSKLFAGAGEIDICPEPVGVGFGLFGQLTSARNYFAPYRFRNYAFLVDGDILIAAWIDLPGLECEGPPIQALVQVAKESPAVSAVVSINYLTGEETPASFVQTGTRLEIEIPRRPDPVLYCQLKRTIRVGPQ